MKLLTVRFCFPGQADFGTRVGDDMKVLDAGNQLAHPGNFSCSWHHTSLLSCTTRHGTPQSDRGAL